MKKKLCVALLMLQAITSTVKPADALQDQTISSESQEAPQDIQMNNQEGSLVDKDENQNDEGFLARLFRIIKQFFMKVISIITGIFRKDTDTQQQDTQPEVPLRTSHIRQKHMSQKPFWLHDTRS